MSITVGNLQVQPAGVTEMTELLALYRQCEDFLALGPRPVASEEMILGDLRASEEDGGIYCVICDRSNRTIGVVDFTPGGRRANPGEAHIELLMLARPYRCQGFGRRIVAAIEAEMWRDDRVRQIAVEVQVNNPEAQRFWSGLGYRVVSGPTDQPDGTTSYQLRKERAP